MTKIGKFILGVSVLSQGLMGYTSALEYDGGHYAHALSAAPQWEVRPLEDSGNSALDGSAREDLTPRSVIDSEPFYTKKNRGKIFLKFHERNFLGDRETHKNTVTEEYEEKMRPGEWVRDAERKLSRLIVKSFFVKNNVEVPFGEEERESFPWVRVEPSEEDRQKTIEENGVKYEFASTEDIWEVSPGVQLHEPKPFEEWKKVYVAAPPAPQEAPKAQTQSTGGGKKKKKKVLGLF
ncbi:MAG: hypothetical protein A2977_00440 [Alphaproteobacteria bacterium RIFCSPLOWO2_01_FULL_45_8]|nr:MAG: hypothetical protein A2065_03200 [Alphaproteobacteria bacterium GWB1_45_5]OFW76578.1 MAG: hypothetical protein A3K20_00125 [Alphaproteobacteria bacterium GWA1_45_9]OFW89662.1 MAG: hypothetical protein A2621_02015 [Alphaproteobacteria bacterium RIFCSPHIGHO2_01_FULL_41_14]OFW96130.1 MAG: hypothetical protein A2977_00440 [Alphaproteobacteria bacterium RIFCSPLOWO2_01_FULL_45_8]HCI49103.1 hypothetical protein [Holosporales bacterium]